MFGFGDLDLSLLYLQNKANFIKEATTNNVGGQGLCTEHSQSQKGMQYFDGLL